MLVEIRADLSELHVSRRAMQQTRPEPGLQFRDVFADRGCGHAQMPSGGGEAAPFSDLHEYADSSEAIHRLFTIWKRSCAWLPACCPPHAAYSRRARDRGRGRTVKNEYLVALSATIAAFQN